MRVLDFPAWYRISKIGTSHAREVHLGDRLALAGVIEQMLEGRAHHTFDIDGAGEVIVDGRPLFEIVCIGKSSPIKPRPAKVKRCKARRRTPPRNKAIPFRAPKRPKPRR